MFWLLFYRFASTRKLSKATLKPNKTSRKNHNFWEKKSWIQKMKYINHCFVWSFYHKFTLFKQYWNKCYYTISHSQVQRFCVYSVVLNLSFRVKVAQSLFCLLLCSNHLINGSKSSIVEVKLIASSSTFLYFFIGPSPDSSRILLFNPLLLNFILSDLLS